MFPVLEIQTTVIRKNTETMVQLCRERDVSIAGVIKGCDALPEVITAIVEGGAGFIADSRIKRLKTAKPFAGDLPLMLLRIPGPSEIEEVVRHADISFNSDSTIIRKLQEEAKRQGTMHKIILLIELGDLREGIYPPERCVEIAKEVEKLPNIELMGIGTNLSCVCGVIPDANNMNRLVEIAEEVESVIGRKLEMISGGATTAVPMLVRGELPKRINNIRLGETLLLGRDMPDFWNFPIEGLSTDAFILKAEVLEVSRKPSKPIGTVFIDAFGNRPAYNDHGDRLRAIIAAGKVDFVDAKLLIPLRRGVEIAGSSSDHLVLDVEHADPPVQVGEVLSFEMYYGPMVYLTHSRYVRKLITCAVSEVTA